jgi:hypothetical protein
MAKVLTSASRICSTGQITYTYRVDDDRKGQSAVIPFHVEDYIEHARLVKKIYGEKNAKAWAAYREFIIPDIHLLLSRAHCDHKNPRRFLSSVRSLPPCGYHFQKMVLPGCFVTTILGPRMWPFEGGDVFLGPRCDGDRWSPA